MSKIIMPTEATIMFKKATSFLTVTSLIIATTMGTTACSSSGSSAKSDVDISKVVDVFESSLKTYEAPTEQAKEVKEATDADMKAFATYTQGKLNSPSFTSDPIGLELKEDGKFQGYADDNGNGTRDSGEDNTFTIEVDTENSRIIATDQATGESTGMHFSMMGFMAGMLLGNLLGRQKRSGVKSFNNRNVKSASEYKNNRAGATGSSSNSNNSSSSNSAKSKSFSGSHSSGK